MGAHDIAKRQRIGDAGEAHKFLDVVLVCAARLRVVEVLQTRSARAARLLQVGGQLANWCALGRCGQNIHSTVDNVFYQ